MKLLNLLEHWICIKVQNVRTSSYGYHRPNIISNNSGKSYIIARKLRHPIIERLDQSTIYVPNDISIGDNDEITQNGMLLYGTNASGKSFNESSWIKYYYGLRQDFCSSK